MKDSIAKTYAEYLQIEMELNSHKSLHRLYRIVRSLRFVIGESVFWFSLNLLAEKSEQLLEDEKLHARIYFKIIIDMMHWANERYEVCGATNIGAETVERLIKGATKTLLVDERYCEDFYGKLSLEYAPEKNLKKLFPKRLRRMLNKLGFDYFSVGTKA